MQNIIMLHSLKAKKKQKSCYHWHWLGGYRILQLTTKLAKHIPVLNCCFWKDITNAIFLQCCLHFTKNGTQMAKKQLWHKNEMKVKSLLEFWRHNRKNSWDWKRQWNGVNQWYKDFSMCQELHMAKWVKENKWVTSWFTYTCKMAVQMVTAWLKLCMKTNCILSSLKMHASCSYKSHFLVQYFERQQLSTTICIKFT